MEKYLPSEFKKSNMIELLGSRRIEDMPLFVGE